MARGQICSAGGLGIARHRSASSTLHASSLALAGLLAILLVATLILPPRPLLVWNVTASSPVGLYWIGATGDAKVGEMVVAWPPREARELGARRHYLPRNVPLVKQVAAVGGDRICAAGREIRVNGRLIVRRQAADPSGRTMPWWTGCVSLEKPDLFLLTPGMPQAFDGRYFGPTRADQTIGRATLIWRA